jgi:hypothetical protein
LLDNEIAECIWQASAPKSCMLIVRLVERVLNGGFHQVIKLQYMTWSNGCNFFPQVEGSTSRKAYVRRHGLGAHDSRFEATDEARLNESNRFQLRYRCNLDLHASAAIWEKAPVKSDDEVRSL